MGLSAGMIALLAGSLGSSVAGSLIGGGGQELQGFEGVNDPEARLDQAFGVLQGVTPAFLAQAGQEVNIPDSVVQQPGGFRGGGLPFDISLTGSDPALSNPSLLRRPGLDLSNFNLGDVTGFTGTGFQRRGPGDGGPFATPEGFRRGDAPVNEERGPAVPRGSVPEQGRRPPTLGERVPTENAEPTGRRAVPRQSTQSGQAVPGRGFTSAPDFQQAQAALELIMNPEDPNRAISR